MVLAFNPKKRHTLAAGAAAALATFLGACSTTPLAPGPGTGPALPSAPGATAGPAPSLTGAMPPPAPREFRAAWVSTVANIDWPSRAGLPVARQQAEAIAILDRAKALNLNAIVLQVRPSADAIYPSELEPWTEYLTGQQGKAPSPMYDPLKFWIDQAHARGLELHAWFNPYRARHATAKSPAARDHISITKPQTVKTYGRYQWMDPGEADASRHTLDVVLDVVKRYDIDGVHIDDYFYPYPIEAPGMAGEAAALEAGNGGNGAARPELDFPDQPAWQRYLASGGALDRASWRRQNVNQLIEAMYTGIHREKSWVRFGISPFGIGRPDRRPPGILGFSQYDKLYADAELWLKNGWLDYLAPQLYWAIAQPPQAFDVLLDYWLRENTRGRHVWPGLYTSRIDASAKSFEPDEIVKQIGVTRSREGRGGNSIGHVHFSIAALMQNRKGISDQLKSVSYQSAALIPATPWLGSAAPGAPTVGARRGSAGLDLKLSAGRGATQYAIWARYGGEWRFTIAPATRSEVTLADEGGVAAGAVVVSAVDRLGNESERVTAQL
ncbi:family 10 glycosylhydrolase [Pseudoduganella sp. LjRoot289]|uniref:glycoside hydrolase family 10 protein n=1 Tax=Pseudoduganella sp. LjRoot289 TaxID=3342314 RepID=UPI003ECCB6AB